MRHFYFAFLFFFLLFGSKAQQVGMYNHYFFNPLVYNPAFAGSSGVTQAALISRAQWTGFNGAPQLNMFTLDGVVKNKKVGLGLTLLSDRRGINQRTGGNLAYAYRLNFNEETYLVLGISAGIVNQSIDFTKAIAENGNDPTLFSGMQQKTAFDGNAGLAFVWKGLQVAAAAPQLFENRLNYVDNTGIRTYYAQARHYMASAKYKFFLSKEKGISVAPQFLMRLAANTPLQYDGNINLDWQNKFWIGATYKNDYAVAVNAGIYIHQNLALGYSYEFITSDIGKYAAISHEIMVSYKFGSHKKEEPDADSLKVIEENKVAVQNASEQRVDSLQEQLDASNARIRELNNKLREQAKAQEETKAQVEELKKSIAQNNANVNSGNQTTTTQNGSNQNNVNANSNSKQNTDQQKANDQKTNSTPVNNQNANTQNTGTGQNSKTQPNTNQNSKAVEQITSKEKVDGVWLASNATTDYKDVKNINPKLGFYVVVGTFFYRDFAEAEMTRFKERGYKASNLLYSEARQFNYIYTNKTGNKQEAILKVKELQKAGIKDAWVLELK